MHFTNVGRALAATTIVLVATFGARPAVAQETGSSPGAQSSPVAPYTEAQAARGDQVFAKVCSFCHASGEFAGATFQTTWNGLSVRKFYDFIRTSMPYDKPGSLTPQQYADVVAYIFQLNAYPATKTEFMPDSMAVDSVLFQFK
jgi:mono/diheme cytochrome c family protein